MYKVYKRLIENKEYDLSGIYESLRDFFYNTPYQVIEKALNNILPKEALETLNSLTTEEEKMEHLQYNLSSGELGYDFEAIEKNN